MRRLVIDLTGLYILVLIVLPILFHWRALTPNALDRGSFPQGDFAEQFYAFARFAADEIQQGRLPLWNPYTYAGHPFLADVQSAVFYPPSLLTIFLSRFVGGFSLYLLEWQAVLHFSLAAVFTFLFARHELRLTFYVFRDERYLSPLTSLCAFLSAIVFTFGGYLTAYPSQQLAVLQTAVWLPLILLWISRQFAPSPSPSPVKRGRGMSPPRGSPVWRALRAAARSAATRDSARAPHSGGGDEGGGIIAGLLFGIAILAGHPQSAMYVLIVSAAYTIFRGRQRAWRWRDIAARLILMVIIALGVSAVQWIPSLEFMQQSSRSTLTYSDYARGFELQDPLQLLLPGSVSYYSPLYVGIVPLALVIGSLWLPRRPRRAVIFWCVLAIAALALSFGGNLFLYPILYLFAPGFALFRQQERAAFIFSFALAMLAGYGALALAHALPRAELRRFKSFARLAVGALCGAIIFFLLIYFAWMGAQLNRESPFRAASSQWAWLLLMLVLLSILLAARLYGKLRRERWLLLVIMATALDLFSVNWHTNFQPTPPEAQTRAPAILAPILSDRSLFRTFNEYRLFGNFGDVHRIEDTGGASPLRLARYDQFMQLPLERIWALLNVRYVITWRKSLNDLGVASEVVASQAIDEKETTYVHRLLNVTARAALVTRVETISSEADALSRLAAPDFDFTQGAIVESPLPAPIESRQSGSVTLVSRDTHRSLWEVNASGDALCVVSENFYPGWRAFVDGRETPVYRANVVMMAVPVPNGTHRVEFVFDPLSVKIGAGVSMVTLVGLLVGWLVSLNRQLPTPNSAPPTPRRGARTARVGGILPTLQGGRYAVSNFR